MSEKTITQYFNDYVPRGNELMIDAHIDSSSGYDGSAILDLAPSGTNVKYVVHTINVMIDQIGDDLGLDQLKIITSGGSRADSPIDLEWGMTYTCWRCLLNTCDHHTITRVNADTGTFQDILFGAIYPNPPLELSANQDDHFMIMPSGTAAKNIRFIVKYNYFTD